MHNRLLRNKARGNKLSRCRADAMLVLVGERKRPSIAQVCGVTYLSAWRSHFHALGWLQWAGREQRRRRVYLLERCLSSNALGDPAETAIVACCPSGCPAVVIVLRNASKTAMSRLLGVCSLPSTRPRPQQGTGCIDCQPLGLLLMA